MPEATRVADARHVRPTTRYVLLNPCRSQLVSNPLRWPYSTLRGVLGAEYDPWVSAPQLAACIGHVWEIRHWFHRYVASDPRLRLGRGRNR